MSNVFRLGSLDQIRVETAPLAAHDPLYRLGDSSSTHITLEIILSSGWKPLDSHNPSYPVRTVDSFTVWTFFINDDTPTRQLLPRRDDPHHLAAIQALNGALQIQYRRRATQMQVPVVPIEFFLIDSELYAYADTNPIGSSPDPIAYLGDLDFSMKGIRSDLLRQSNALLLQTSLTAAPAPSSNVSTPRASPLLSKRALVSALSPTTRETAAPRTCSSSGVRRAATVGSSPASQKPQQQQQANVRACICKPTSAVSKFAIDRHPLADAVTLPNIISIRFGPKITRFLPRRLRYGPISTSPNPAAIAGANDAMDVDLCAQRAETGQVEDDPDCYVTDTSSDSGDVQSSASLLFTAAKTSRLPRPEQEHLDATTLLLLQQHVHDPFFGAVLAQTWRQAGTAPAIAFPTYLAQSCGEALRVRQLLLASSLLPSWRAVTNPLPVQQTRPDQVSDLKGAATAPAIDQVVVNDCDLLLGFDGDIRTMSAAAVEFWEESCLEPFKSKADVSYLVILPHETSPSVTFALVEPFIESISCLYETSMLGHHLPIKCFKEILALATQFQETIAAGASPDDDLSDRYYEFVLDAMNCATMRSKLISTDTSVVVIYIVVDGVLPINLQQFASFINRLRLILGAPSWNSASRRKNVVAQIVPLSMIHGLHVSHELSSITALRQMVFSVFSRNHFVPAIPLDSDLIPKLDAGLGLTAFEPAYVVHNESFVPNPIQTNQRSRLSVHLTYVSIPTSDYHEWIFGCATDMRGERLHTTCVQRIIGQPLTSAFNSLWSECLRPVLDFLHSRTDQGPMTVAVFKSGTMSSEECSTWASLFADRLGGDWVSFREQTLRCNSPGSMTNSDPAVPADVRLSVSAVFLMSCPSSAMLQLIEEASHQNNSFVLHQHQLLRDYKLDASIICADLYFRDGSSIRCQLERYIVHGKNITLEYGFVLDAYRALIQQTLALNVFSAGPGAGLPLHFATSQRLALSLTAVLPQLNRDCAS